jgi:hypothetical protein
MTTRVPGIAFCMAQLGLVRLSLRAMGFGRTLARFEHSVGPAAPTMSPDDPMIGLIAQRVAAAAALYPGRARCLEQSLVLNRELRRRGADAKLRFGVHPYPFGAHAWVEVCGRAINEPDDYLKMFTPLQD